jgi:hypothetical protein
LAKKKKSKSKRNCLPEKREATQAALETTEVEIDTTDKTLIRPVKRQSTQAA